MPELTTKSSDLSKKIISSLERLQGRGAWKRRLLQLEEKYGADAYRSLFYILAHLDFAPRRAKNHWQKLLDVWEELDRKTGSRLDLRVVVVHYFLKVQKKLRNPAIVEINFLQHRRPHRTNRCRPLSSQGVRQESGGSVLGRAA